MISLKRLEAMKQWQKRGFAGFWAHTAWGFRAGLLRVGVQYRPFFPTERLASAIVKAEAEHARHKTVQRREQTRREADYCYLLHLAERRLAAKERE